MMNTTAPPSELPLREWSSPAAAGNKNKHGSHQHHTNTNSNNKGRPVYKHVPHREKPPHLVARRNARERKRVQAVNLAFIHLRRALPIESRGKRVSKVKTLKTAMDYIAHLVTILSSSLDLPFMPYQQHHRQQQHQHHQLQCSAICLNSPLNHHAHEFHEKENTASCLHHYQDALNNNNSSNMSIYTTFQEDPSYCNYLESSINF
ncbi:unnamed protein product [Notodromas monacha]|uniref:BHLH domain-containing protein n=1 Tax=Notodromas monacha TaxID=399045 RepID=A0A7R9GDC8_9CRUS|nr:unnamed protein product [Notodromas monacha]CAG0917042.1 unnamed protein product [Notodromas monacha]